MKRLLHRLPFLVIIATILILPAVALAAPSDDLTALAKRVDASIAKLEAGDVAGARTEYLAFDDGWFDIEDGIRALSRARYRSIEDAMGDAKFALTSTPPDTARAMDSLKRLRGECDGFIQEYGSGAPQVPQSAEQ